MNNLPVEINKLHSSKIFNNVRHAKINGRIKMNLHKIALVFFVVHLLLMNDQDYFDQRSK